MRRIAPEGRRTESRRTPVFLRAPLALLLSGLLLLSSSASAVWDDPTEDAGSEGREPVRFRGFSARLENDVFASADRNYSSGVAFMLTSQDMPGPLEARHLPLPMRLHSAIIKFANPGFWSDARGVAQTYNVVLKVGQSVYTPEDPCRTDLVSDDRPYAGLLYVGLSWNRRRHEPGAASEMLDTRETTLGVIGPWSMAEQAQNAVHSVLGSVKFMGWEHQLENEPALQMALERKWKPYRGAGTVTPGLSADTVWSAGIRLGNIETSGTLGAEGRVGWNLPNDFGSYPIRPGAENRPPSAASIRGRLDDPDDPTGPRPGVHLFGTIEIRLVAHDFSLDGNLFQSGHQVTRRPWVVQAAFGVSIQGLVAEHGFRLAVMRVIRTMEFQEQDSNQIHGSVAVSVEF